MTPRKSLLSALQEGGDRASAGAGRHRMRNLLIVAQVAISFVLLAGAGLLLRTLWNLQQVDPGFKTQRVLTARLDLNYSRYSTPETRRDFHDRLLERIAQEPGVVSAALSGTFPLNDSGGPNTGRYRVEGRDAPGAPLSRRADFQFVSPDFYAVIGTPVVRGRAFAASDRPDHPAVAIVNETMARHIWPGEDPVGKRIAAPFGSGPGSERAIEVVGVAGDVRQYGLTSDPIDQVFLSLAQFPTLSTTCLVRTSADPLAMTRQVRKAVHTIGPEQPVDRFRTLEQERSGALESPRLTAILLALFAGLALMITATGIAGVIGFSVGQRLPEFGIRMALGARPAEIVSMVLRQGMTHVAAGLALGLTGAIVLTRLLSGLLFGVAPTDIATLSGVLVLLAFVAAAACFVPARRATSANPMAALRSS